MFVSIFGVVVAVVCSSKKRLVGGGVLAAPMVAVCRGASARMLWREWPLPKNGAICYASALVVVSLCKHPRQSSSCSAAFSFEA